MKRYRPGWLNRYMLLSLFLHLLLLLLISHWFEEQPGRQTSLTFELVNPVLPEKVTKPKPLRHYLDEKPIDPNAKISINKDGRLKGETEVKKKQPGTKHNRQEYKDKIFSFLPPVSENKTQAALPPSQRIIELPPEPGDIFIKPYEKNQAKEADETEKPKLEEILANLEKYIDFDKYSQQAYYFGGSKLSFEDQDFNYVWYGRIIKRRVADGWYPPYVARMGLTGRTVITFKIQRNGEVNEIKLNESSGNKSLDQAALNAIQSVGRLPELPEDYKRSNLGVVFSFWYNLQIPSENGAS